MNEVETDFLTAAERDLGDRFLRDGHVVCPVGDRPALDRIRARVAELAAAQLDLAPPLDAGAFLDGVHRHVGLDRLNEVRLAVYHGINAEPWFRPAYYALAREVLATVVGNELAMQRRVNLSIQLPDDDSSLLPVHADVWSGDSPFEVVVWLPLVDCRRTKSMFLLPPGKDAPMQARLAEFQGRSVDDLYHAIEPDLVWIDAPYGTCLVFTQNLMHGNRINREPETRWSMNCRFKSLLSPYADKRLDEFFDPITVRPATRLGMNYRLPTGFHE